MKKKRLREVRIYKKGKISVVKIKWDQSRHLEQAQAHTVTALACQLELQVNPKLPLLHSVHPVQVQV